MAKFFNVLVCIKVINKLDNLNFEKLEYNKCTKNIKHEKIILII